MNIKKIASICLLTAAMYGCISEEREHEKLFKNTGADSESNTVSNPVYDTIRLGITDYETIPISECKASYIQYCGMSHPLSFQLLGRGADPVMSYPSNSSQIMFYKYNFDVLKLTPDSLIVRYRVPE